jgi:hypothetical protein
LADCQICARLRTREGRETRCNSNTSTSSTAAAAYPRCSHGDSGTFIDVVWGFSASATERTAYSSGVADDKASALELALALHLSAAVGGTPNLKALELISELEGMDRGRYGRSDGSTRAETASSASPCARPLSTATGSACSPARGSSQTPTPRRSSPRPPPSSCRSGTRWALNGQPARQPGCVRS